MSNSEDEQTEPVQSTMDEFTVVIEPDLRWGDLDAFNHVNNTIFFRYMESVRIAYFEKAGVLSYMNESGCGPILADASCRFIKPLTYPDKLRAGARVEKVGNTSFQLAYKIWSSKSGLAATGSSAVVYVNYKTGKSMRIPDVIRDAIRAIEPSTVEGL